MAKARPITGLDPQAPTEGNARLVARERLADMDAFVSYVENPESIQELHDLRIAAKRLRYTLEVFAEMLPAQSQEFVDELTTLQDELGALHDSEVMLALLHLLLPPEQASSASGRGNPLLAPGKNLLSPDMAEHIVHAARRSSPSARETRGLADFFHRQEERRVQAYNSFRRHWEALEQRRFRAALAQMLAEQAALIPEDACSLHTKR